MSVINEVVKKRGRPAKVQPELPVAQVTNDDSKEQARKAVEEILSQASAQASEQTALVETPVDISGAKTGASSHDNLDLGQADYIPGTRILDIQMVPNIVYDELRGGNRRLGLPNDYHYCWVHTDKVTQFRIMSYKFCLYNGGNQSGLSQYGFEGTGIYEKTFDNHVRNGDMFLMWIANRAHETMVQEDLDYRTKMESAVEDQIHNDGYRKGIRTFKEVGGVTIYN